MPAGGRILAPGPGGQLPATSGEHRVRHRTALLRRARLLARADQPIVRRRAPCHAEIRMSENCRYTPHYGPADQLIRWAKFTMNPSGPRTDAMRQMPSY